jgi:hypothetical protein
MTPHRPLQESSGKKNKRYKDVSDDDSTMMSPAKKRRRRKSIAPSFFVCMENLEADLHQGDNDMKDITKYEQYTHQAQINLKSSQKKRDVSNDSLDRVKKERHTASIMYESKQHDIHLDILQKARLLRQIEEIDQRKPVLMKERSDASDIANDRKREDVARDECAMTQLAVERHSSNFKNLNQTLEEFQVSYKSAFLVRWRDRSPQQVFAELGIPFAYTAMAELGITQVQLRNITKALKFFGFPGAKAMHTGHRKKGPDIWDGICEVVGIALPSVDPIFEENDLIEVCARLKGSRQKFRMREIACINGSEDESDGSDDECHDDLH